MEDIRPKAGNFFSLSMEISIYRPFLIFILFCSWTRAIRRKKPAFLFPIIPLGFVLTYQYDLGYGTLLQRMKGQFLIKQSLFLIHLLVQGSSPYDHFIYGHFDKTPLSELPMTNISAPSHSSVLQSTHTSSRELSNFQEFVSWLLNTVIIKN